MGPKLKVAIEGLFQSEDDKVVEKMGRWYKGNG